MDHTQSADTLIVVQEDMAPKKIVRGGSHNSWTISDISFEFIPKFNFTHLKLLSIKLLHQCCRWKY